MSSSDRITEPLFAPEWPDADPSPTRAMRRLAYIDAHSPVGSTAPSRATIVANRVMTFDRAGAKVEA